MQAYTPPLSLWRLVEQHVPPHEQDEIKTMLSSSLVEQSLELHGEIEMLLDIWREMRDERSEQAAPVNRLPEPPNQRDRLVQEICFFVDSVKSKAKEKGIDPKHILKNHNSGVLEYATEFTRPGSAMSRTSRSSDGRETPMMALSPNRINFDYELTDEVEAVNAKLNYLDFDKVCEDLRSTLEKEVDQLMGDIQFLQTCLDSEADCRDSITPCLTSREPTLTELREERSLLEKELLAADKLRATPSVNKPIFNSATTVLPRTPPGSSGTSSTPVRPAPIKASHNVAGPLRAQHDIKPTAIKEMDPCSRSGHGLSVKSSPSVNISASKPSVGHDDTSGDISTLKGDGAAGDSPTGPSTTSTPVSAGSKTNFTLPNPPAVPHSDNSTRHSLLHQRVPHAPASPRGSEQSQLMAATTPEGIVVSRGGARRRTVSPGRIRVVDFTSLVESHSGKGDGSSTTTAFNPSPPSSALERDSSLRPSSAHADRFRKMVLGCRDGE